MPKISYLFLAIAWTLAVTTLSLADVGTLGNSIKIPHKDKMLHFVFYFLFYLLWFLFFKNKTTRFKIALLLIAIGYGILMEVLQAIMGNHRSSDFYDVLANSLGSIAGLFFVNRFVVNKK
ncbi:MAG: VanZ family protein [Flavobacterium sp.]|nr:VanZ family protein [Flavobacterium sp.]